MTFFSQLISQVSQVSFLKLSGDQWLILLGFVCVSFVLGKVCGVFLNSFVKHVFMRSQLYLARKEAIDRLSIVPPFQLLIIGWVVTLGGFLFDVTQVLQDSLVSVSKVTTYVGLIWLGLRGADLVHVYLSSKADKTASKFDDLLPPLVTRTLKVLVIVLGFISLAELLELPLASLLTGLGIGGLAIAMAAKDMIANIFGSLTVVADRPFTIGDWVRIGDVEGTVEELGFRSTRIRTFYNSLIVLPNSLLLTSVVDNMGERQYRRYTTKLGLVYGTPAEKMEGFCEGVRELIRQHPKTRKDYFMVYFNDFSASSLDVLLYCFFEVVDWEEELQMRHRLLLDITRLAQTMGVSFAFPTQTVVVEQGGAQVASGLASAKQVDEARESGRTGAAQISDGFY